MLLRKRYFDRESLVMKKKYFSRDFHHFFYPVTAPESEYLSENLSDI
jgi:hypothetical protein